MKYLNNRRGVGLVGTMIGAAVGLVVVLGISKGLMNFASQAAKVKRITDV